MKKKYKVVMLPTSDKIVNGSLISRRIDDKLAIVNPLTINDKNAERDGHQNNHIYFISEEEIKVGDYIPMYNEHSNALVSFKRWEGEMTLPSTKLKVVATTDNGLFTEDDIIPYTSLPQIPQSFLKEYCKNPVEEVYLEVELTHNSSTSIAEIYAVRKSDEGEDYQIAYDRKFKELDDPAYRLKLTSNNEVIISKVEEKTYSRAEGKEYKEFIKNVLLTISFEDENSINMWDLFTYWKYEKERLKYEKTKNKIDIFINKHEFGKAEKEFNILQELMKGSSPQWLKDLDMKISFYKENL